MKIALLGCDPTVCRLVEQALRGFPVAYRTGVAHGEPLLPFESGSAEIVAAVDATDSLPQLRRLAPGLREEPHWEMLLTDQADIVVVSQVPPEGAARDRREEQLRKLAVEGPPLVLVLPACDPLFGYELDMISRDSGVPLIPYAAGSRHPLLGWMRTRIAGDAEAPCGRIEQIEIRHPLASRTRDAAIAAWSHDLHLISQLGGSIEAVTALGAFQEAAAESLRDQKSAKRTPWPAGASLAVSRKGPQAEESPHSLITIQWSLAPAVGSDRSWRFIGSRGEGNLLLAPAESGWRLEWSTSSEALSAADREMMTAGPAAPVEDSAAKCLAVAAWHVVQGRKRNPPASEQRSESPLPWTTWGEMCLEFEATAGLEESARRGRTIPLLHHRPSEEGTFKGVMAAGGCLLLLLGLLMLLLFSLPDVLGLSNKTTKWIWGLWPICLAAPLILFLSLQLLQFVFRAPDRK